MGYTVLLNKEFNASVTRESEGELRLDFSFDQFSPNANLLEDWAAEFIKHPDPKKDSVGYIDNWIDTFGPINNIPCQVLDESSGIKVLDGYVDLSNEQNQYSDFKQTYKLLVKNRRKSFFEIAEDFNLLGLFENSTLPANVGITTNDFGRVFTSQVKRNQAEQLALLSIIAFIVGLEVARNVRESADLVAKSVNAILYGLSAAGASADVGIETATSVAITTLLIAEFIILLKSIAELINNPPKLYYSVRVLTLLNRACRYLGYDFTNTLFTGDYANLHYLASTDQEPVDSGNPRNNPIPDITIAEFFENIGLLFNAKLKVDEDNKRVFFRNKKEYQQNPQDLTLPNMKNNGAYTYNYSELPRQIRIKYLKDSTEQNTFTPRSLLGISTRSRLVQNGLSQAGTETVVSYFYNNTLERGLQAKGTKLDIDLPYSRVARKEGLTKTEKTFNDIVNALSILTTGIKRINDRTGQIQLENPYIQNDKIFIKAGNFVSEQDAVLLHSEYIYRNFYRDSEAPMFNQYKVFTEVSPIPICDTEIISKLQQNNVIKDDNNQVKIITKNIRNDIDKTHEIEYRVEVKRGDSDYLSPRSFTEKIDNL